MWHKVTEVGQRLIGREESPWYCEEGRGWRLCGGDSALDIGEYRSDRTGRESRDLGSGDRERAAGCYSCQCFCKVKIYTRVSIPLFCSAILTSLFGVERSRGDFPSTFRQDPSAPKSSKRSTTTTPPLRTAACSGLSCPHPIWTSAPTRIHEENMTSLSLQNGQVMWFRTHTLVPALEISH